MTTPLAARRRRTARVHRVLAWTGVVTVCLSTGFLAFASSPMTAEDAPLAEARETITVTESREGVILTPASPNGEGLIFFAGARVDPAAYAHKLAGIAENGTTVVIARPLLNFAIFESRPLTTWTDRVPGVDTWSVGGHSLGGVKACMYAADPANDVDAVVLFGSYCSVDLSATSLDVLSLAAENDGLSTQQKIDAASGLLPAGAVMVTIPGATHAQFGDYGEQPGDGVATVDDHAVRTAIIDAYSAFRG